MPLGAAGEKGTHGLRNGNLALTQKCRLREGIRDQEGLRCGSLIIFNSGSQLQLPRTALWNSFWGVDDIGMFFK